MRPRILYTDDSVQASDLAGRYEPAAHAAARPQCVTQRWTFNVTNWRRSLTTLATVDLTVAKIFKVQSWV